MPPTSSRHRSYKSARREDLEPLGFDIDDEEFTCVPKAPSGVFLDIAGKMDADGNITLGAAALVDFFHGVLLRTDAVPSNNGTPPRASSYDRFNAFLHDQERIVDIEQLAQICQDLMEDYSGRPTSAPSPSPS